MPLNMMQKRCQRQFGTSVTQLLDVLLPIANQEHDPEDPARQCQWVPNRTVDQVLPLLIRIEECAAQAISNLRDVKDQIPLNFGHPAQHALTLARAMRFQIEDVENGRIDYMPFCVLAYTALLAFHELSLFPLNTEEGDAPA